MHNPPGPGDLIKQICLEPLDLSVTEAAKLLKIHRTTLSKLLNGRGRITPAIAESLGNVFDTTAESWLHQQENYDEWINKLREMK